MSPLPESPMLKICSKHFLIGRHSQQDKNQGANLSLCKRKGLSAKLSSPVSFPILVLMSPRGFLPLPKCLRQICPWFWRDGLVSRGLAMQAWGPDCRTVSTKRKARHGGAHQEFQHCGHGQWRGGRDRIPGASWPTQVKSDQWAPGPRESSVSKT